MNATLHNGRQQPTQNTHQRKQLSDQLDRFDEILDGLADGLNEAMADAAREGTRLAVKDAIVEILTNPDLKAAVQWIGAATPPVTAPIPSTSPRSVWDKVKAIIRRARAAVTAAVRKTRTFVTNKVRATTRVVVGAGRITVSAWRVKRAVVATAVIGVALGAGAYYSAPHAGAVLSAAAGAVVAVAVRIAFWVRTALRTILPA